MRFFSEVDAAPVAVASAELAGPCASLSLPLASASPSARLRFDERSASSSASSSSSLSEAYTPPGEIMGALIAVTMTAVGAHRTGTAAASFDLFTSGKTSPLPHAEVRQCIETIE